MSSAGKCRECGAVPPAGGPPGLCAKCLLSLGLGEVQNDEGERQKSEEPKSPQVAAALTEKPGDRIGGYKLLEQIGQGGFGVVYMAEQKEPVKRRVALKIIKLGMDTKEVVARFEAER